MTSQAWYYGDSPPHPHDPHENKSGWPYEKRDVQYTAVPVDSNVTTPPEPHHQTDYVNYNATGEPQYTQYTWGSPQPGFPSPTNNQQHVLSSPPLQPLEDGFEPGLGIYHSAYPQHHYDTSSSLSTSSTFPHHAFDPSTGDTHEPRPPASHSYSWPVSMSASTSYPSYNVDDISSTIQRFNLSSPPLGPGGLFTDVSRNPSVELWSPVSLSHRKVELAEELRYSMNDRNTSIQNAVKDGDWDHCRDLIAQGHNIDEINTHGYTAVHFAAAYDQSDILGALLEAGADPEVKGKGNVTPLHLATFVDSVSCVNKLLDYVPQDWELEDDENTTPYGIALKNGCIDNINYFLEVGAKVPEDELQKLISAHDIATQSHIRQLVNDYGRTAIEKLQLRDQLPDDVKAYVETLFSEELSDAYNIIDGLNDISREQRDDIRELLRQHAEEIAEPDEPEEPEEESDEDEAEEVQVQEEQVLYEPQWTVPGAFPLSNNSAPATTPYSPVASSKPALASKEDDKIRYFDDAGALRFLDFRGCTARNKSAGDFAPNGLDIIVDDLRHDRIRSLYISSGMAYIYLPEKSTQTSEETFEESISSLFEWLTDFKGVYSVSEIRVHDPCTDFSSSNLTRWLVDNNAPRFMGIRKLCWIEPAGKPFEPVQAAPEVEELWVSWNGEDLNSRLEGLYGAIEPLQRLVKLSFVVEHDVWEMDIKGTVDDNRQIAANWMSQNLPGRSIEVDVEDLESLFHPKIATKTIHVLDIGTSGATASALSAQNNLTPDGWFTSMKRYDNYTSSGIRSRDISSSLMSGTGEPIKVAVIDTGIDCGHDSFSGNIIARKAFPPNMHDFLDLQGHGTHVAGLILQVAPNAQLLCARVFDDSYANKTSYLADAIDWALKQDAKVICCSWGLYQGNEPLVDACRRANLAGCLIFGAGSNSGANRKSLPYPAICSEVISIGACNENGKKCDITHSNTKFWFPGESINSEHPRYLNTDADGTVGQKVRTGCSMANALAVGLAARFMEKARECLVDDEIYRFERNAQLVMKQLFSRLTSSDAGLSSKYVSAWHTLSEQARSTDELGSFFRQTLRHLGLVD